MVIAFHSTLYARPEGPPWTWLLSISQRMWLGVPIFFVISGYCITATADSSRRKNRGWWDYTKRRIRRIFLPYWIAFAAFAVVVTAVDTIIPHLFSDDRHEIIQPIWLSPRQWLTNLSLTESWMGQLAGHVRYFLGHAWSLCYEEQFYALTGLIVAFAPQRYFLACAALTAAVFAAISAASRAHIDVTGVFFDGYWL